MEINNISNNSIHDLANVKDSVNLTDVSPKELSNNLNNISNAYLLDQNIPSTRSELSNNLSQHLTTISKSQVEISNLNKQSNILNDISQLTLEITSSSSPEVTADAIQPALAQLMTNYNDLTPKMQLTQDTNADTDSTAYFDGVLGAKPISVSDITAAVEEQMQIVKQNTQIAHKQIQEVKTHALNTIGEEIAKNDEQKPFKNIDFGKATSDFSAASINNVIGSVALTQANAIPAQAQKLLY